MYITKLYKSISRIKIKDYEPFAHQIFMIHL